MDRSFLSDPAVITASRQFVCARLATYEDESENRFLKGLVRTGSGELENTVFAIFAPDGQTKLVRSNRGAAQVFGNAAEMAKQMNGFATTYPAKVSSARPLPTIATVPLAVTVSAADNLPLIVYSGPDAGRKTLAELAWSREWIGRFNYAVIANDDDWNAIPGAKPQTGITIVQPERFGRTGSVLVTVKADTDWPKAMSESLKTFQAFEKSQRTHIRDGAAAGVFYEPKTPVTDPMEQKARERLKKK